MFVMPMPGKSAAQQWQNNSTLAYDLIAAGAFDQAMHVLNRTIGVVNFEPLKPAFLSIYSSAYASLPQLPGAASLVSALQRPADDDGKKLPVVTYNLAQCVEVLKRGYKGMTDGKFATSLADFTELLHTLPVLTVEKKAQVAEVLELRNICKEYVTALRLEMARKEEKDPIRQASLAAYFTQCKLQPVHIILSLRVAIKACYTIKCFKTTAGFCRRVLDLAVSSNQASIQKIVNFKQIRGVLKLCEKENSEAHDLNFPDTSNLSLCAASLSAIPKGTQSIKCPYCESQYMPSHDGAVCSTCSLSKVGMETTGLKVFAEI